MRSFVVVALGTLALTAWGARPFCGLAGLTPEGALATAEPNSSNPFVARFTKGLASLKRKTPTLDRLKLEASQVRPDRPQSRKNSQRANLWALRERLDEAGPSLQVEERRQLLEETLKDWSTIVPEPMSALDSNEIAQLAHLLNWPDTGSANISVQASNSSNPFVARFTKGLASLKRDGGDRREAVKTPTLDRLKLEASQVRPDRPQSRKDSQRANLWALRERLDEAGPSLQVEERRQLLEETLKDWSTIVPEPMSALDSNEIAQLAHLLNWPDTGSANISVPRVRPGQPGAQ